MQSGHLIDGRTVSILLDERGIKPQCVGCNMFKSGNKQEFIPKFIDEHGRELYDELLALSKQTKNVSIEEYEEIIKGYKKRLKNSRF